MRIFRIFFCGCLLAGLALHAQEQPPKQLIEEVVFRNLKRISEHVLMSELNMVEGMAYSEAQLREAHFRLERLPFVREVAFALRKGSKRGNYRLEITVQETYRFFWVADFTYDYLQDDTPQYERGFEPSANNLGFGWRWFTKKGEFQVLIPGVVSYTRYNPWGKDMILNVSAGVVSSNLGTRVGFTKSGPYGPDGNYAKVKYAGGALAISGLAGFRVGNGNHWVNVGASRAWSGINRLETLGTDYYVRDSNSSLSEIFTEHIYNSTDETLFITKGLRIQSGLAFTEEDTQFETPDFAPVVNPATRRYTLFNSGVKAWALRRNQGLGLRWSGWYSKIKAGTPDEAAETLEFGDYSKQVLNVNLFWGRNFMRPKLWGGSHDFRLELKAGAEKGDASIASAFPVEDDPRVYGQFSITGRSNHGVWRFSIGYTKYHPGVWR